MKFIQNSEEYKIIIETKDTTWERKLINDKFNLLVTEMQILYMQLKEGKK